MTAFTGQNWPGASDTRSVKSAAVVLLPIAIMIVAAPAWALGQIVFEHCVYDRDRVHDDGIIRRPHPKPDQLEKIPSDDVSGGMFAATVGDLNDLSVGINRPIGRLRNG